MNYKSIFKQRSNLRLGAFIVTFQKSIAWFSILVFAYTSTILWSVKQDMILAVVPWMNLPLFILLSMVLPLMFVMLMEFLILTGSSQAYSNSQELKHQSPYAAQLKRIEDNQQKIMQKMGMK
jgi:hypothetical protein